MTQADDDARPASFLGLVPPGRDTSLVTSAGLPFLRWADAEDSDFSSLDVANAQWLYVLGCVHSEESPNPPWGSGDPSRTFFVGEQVGALELVYGDAPDDVDEVPLIFGHTLWWESAYRNAHVPFSHDGVERDALARSLFVANAIDSYRSQWSDPYFIRIALRPDRMLRAVRVASAPNKVGHVVISGLTVQGAEGELVAPAGRPIAGVPARGQVKEWLAEHTVVAGEPLPRVVAEALGFLERRLSTTSAMLTHEAVASLPPVPFDGPEVRFTGPVEAEILTRVWADSARETLARIESDGTIRESAIDAPYYPAFGTKQPGAAPFHRAAFSRNRVILLAGQLGFLDAADRAVTFFDDWMMYFPRNSGELRIAGQPVPGHATVVVNRPHLYFDTLQHVGDWPTKLGDRDFGNAEIDGHGILMLSRWRHWLALGRPREWLADHWEAIREAAEFLCWSLENPESSFSRNGLLYSESEGGLAQLSIYANVPCAYGLDAYAEMALALGEGECAERWEACARRLTDAIGREFLVTIDSHDVWDTERAGMWPHGQGVLAPLLFALDRWGPDAARHLPEKWLARTQDSFDLVLGRLTTPFCAPEGLGYGQNYYAQTALALDRMDDATALVEWLARLCFAPHDESPFRVPEGASVGRGGAQWRRWGDLGNLYQMADTVFTIATMVGIDDLDSGTLRVMPRLPLGWSSLSVSDWPVTSGERTRVSYELVRREGDSLEFRLEAEVGCPVDVRLGPFSRPVIDIVALRGRVESAQPGRVERIAGSYWIWVSVRSSAGIASVVANAR